MIKAKIQRIHCSVLTLNIGGGHPQLGISILPTTLWPGDFVAFGTMTFDLIVTVSLTQAVPFYHLKAFVESH